MADEQGYDALAREHTSDPQANVDDVLAEIAKEETPRDETGRFVARTPEEDVIEAAAEEAAPEESEPAEGEAEAKPDAEEDAAPEEASGEEAEDDEPVEAIDAPASWTDEERAAFAELPPATQATIAARESERETTINARLAEAAATRKAAQADQEAAQTERQNMANTLAQVSAYARTMDPIIAKGLNTDWAELAREEGADEAMAQKAEFDQRVQYLQAVEQETARLQQASVEQHKQKETASLHEKMPDFTDEAKAKAFKDASLPTLLEAGYTPQEVDQFWDYVPDHRQALILDKAAKYDKLMKERATISQKKAAPKAVKVQKPKAAQDTQAENSRVTALRKHVDQSPNDYDALTELAQRTIGAS